MKNILQYILKFLSQKIIKKYQPMIVGITGSVGKTSAKEAIQLVLEKKFSVRSSLKNYNNELGLPLTIINAKAQGKSALGWLAVFCQAIFTIIFKTKNYPQVLVLEMGVDRPGDMDYFNSFISCDIGVITMIGQAHIEFFETMENIAAEKGKLLDNLKQDGWAIINFDNELTRQMAGKRKNTISFGMDNNADLICADLQFKYGENGGADFNLAYQGKKENIFVPNVNNKPAIYALLSGAAAGLAYGMQLNEIAEVLAGYNPPKGRMNVIKGLNCSWIVDDTYNASPQSVSSAIADFKSIPSEGRKIIALGDMLELGAHSVSEHRRVGQMLDESIDYLITVGNFSSLIIDGAKMSGFNTLNYQHFDDSLQAGAFLHDYIKPGDWLLIKGSQGIRMEKAVKAIMAEPENAGKLLVRQDEQWKNK